MKNLIPTLTNEQAQSVNDKLREAAACIVETGTQHIPVVALFKLTPRGPEVLRVASPPFSNEQEQAAAAMMMRKLLALPEVDALAFVAEAHAAEVPNDGDDAEAARILRAVDMGEQSAEQSARDAGLTVRETIVIYIATKSDQWESLNHIERDGNKARLLPGELVCDADGDRFGGTFALLS